MSSTASNTATTNKPTILIMAGGTGGHIFPGIAVADELKSRGWNVHWLGTATRMEAQLIPEYGYDISFINIAGVRHKNWQALLTMPFKLLQSLWQSAQVISKVKPNVVLGMGGYASAPGGIAAKLLGKPLVLHEQNAVAGMSNRYLAFIANKVLGAFPGAFKNVKNYQVVGNPLRSSIIDLQVAQPLELLAEKNKTKKILIVGGSLGAKILNETVPHAINQFKREEIEVWHQTGKGNRESVLASYKQYELLENKVKIDEFIDDMAAAYLWADVVICRAGALTVSELAMVAKPALFIPLPHAVDDHQTKNAMYLVDRGAAKVLAQSELNSTSLTQMLNTLFASEQVLSNMATAALDAAYPNATKQVADVCAGLLKQ